MEKKIYGVEAFLNRPKALEEEIRGDIDHIASLRSIVEKTTMHLSFTAGRNPSRNEKTFESAMIQIAEEEAALEGKKKLLVESKIEVEAFIRKIPSRDQQSILRYVFLQSLPMSEILDRMDLSKTSGYRLYSAAMETASEVFAIGTL